MKLSNNKILITGGATGIGIGLTERFIKENNTVIICGRREAALKEAADKFPSVITRVCDLSVASERAALCQWISEEHADLNVLINNAGIQNWVTVEDPTFFEKAQQEIANVTSGLAFAPFAKIPVYSATKAFMRSFTLSLRHTLKAKNIEVIEIIPPALKTDLGGPNIHNAAPPVSDFIESIFGQLKEGKPELTFGTSGTRANASAEELRNYFNVMNAS